MTARVHASTPAGAVECLRSEARSDFLGAPIDCLTRAATLAIAETAMRERRPVMHVCLNVAKFVAMRTDPELDADVRSADIVSVDGAGILWAARLLGIAVPERVTGIDLFQAILSLCAARGFRPYFLGAQAAVLDAAIARLKARHEAIVLAGKRDGYFRPDQEDAVVEAIRQSGADCLFIAMPTPLKERFIHRHRDRLGVPFVMGVGGSFDVLAGKTSRAPGFVQAAGLEWAWRVMQEPRRLGPRYLRTNIAFAGIIGRAMLSAGARRARIEPSRVSGGPPRINN